MMLLFVSAASAFCGTFVGADGALLENRASQVVLARSGTTTTLTLAVDYQGSATDFALLLPIPEVLTASEVRTVEPDLLAKVAEWSSPREVAYTCDDIVDVNLGFTGCSGTLGCSTSDYVINEGGFGEGEAAAGTVSVESTFSEAGYTFSVLDATTAGALQAWLDENGYALPAGGDAILQEYIDAGVYFLAAKVALEASASEPEWLPPIQVTYDAESFGLPIRLGTISASGPQEVLLFVLTENGAAGISNYDEVEVVDECLRNTTTDFSTFYASELDTRFAGAAGWLVEYSWSLVANCDPCTAVTGFTPEELVELGMPNYHGWLTRMRVRYSPEEAVADLNLYSGGDTGNAGQVRYIQDNAAARELYPVCGETEVNPSGECFGPEREGPFGFAAALPAGAIGLILAAAAARRRA